MTTAQRTSTMTTEPLTDEMIRALHREAVEHGDDEMADECGDALDARSTRSSKASGTRPRATAAAMEAPTAAVISRARPITRLGTSPRSSGSSAARPWLNCAWALSRSRLRA